MGCTSAPVLFAHRVFDLTKLEIENYNLTIKIGNIVAEKTKKLIGLVRNEVVINDYQRIQNI